MRCLRTLSRLLRFAARKSADCLYDISTKESKLLVSSTIIDSITIENLHTSFHCHHFDNHCR